MRIPVVATVLLLAAIAGLGWHNQQRIASLRADHRKLAAQAAARGILPDPAHPENRVRLTKRPRVDRAAEAKRFAVELIAYAEEMHEQSQPPDPVTKLRMMDQMDRLMALDGEQLKIVIGEIHSSGEIEDELQMDLLRFLIERLSRDQPKDAVMILMDSPGLLELLRRNHSGGDPTVSAAFGGWVKTDAQAALDWYRKNHEKFTGDLAELATSELIHKSAESDLRLAISLVGEFGKEPGNFVPYIVGRRDQTPEERTASLVLLREYIGTIVDDEVRSEIYAKCLERLALGTGLESSTSFQSATRWLDESNLSQKELESLLHTDLGFYVKPEEIGQWVTWLGKTYPLDTARETLSRLFTKWLCSNREAAEQWISSGPDSLIRNVAIDSYAELLFPADREAAIQRALSVPDKHDRERTLRKLYHNWPQIDPADKAAGEAFAKALGIK